MAKITYTFHCISLHRWRLAMFGELDLSRCTRFIHVVKTCNKHVKKGLEIALGVLHTQLFAHFHLEMKSANGMPTRNEWPNGKPLNVRMEKMQFDHLLSNVYLLRAASVSMYIVHIREREPIDCRATRKFDTSKFDEKYLNGH